MHRTVQRITQFVSRLLAHGASLAMFALFAIIFINSVRRYAFGRSLEWGEELPVYLAIYGIMFGIAWAYLEDRHIRFTMLVGFLPENLTKKLYILVDLIMTATGAVLTYSAWLFVIKRGSMESSGLIGLAKDLREFTGWENLIWLGHLYPYQAATVIGGVLLTLAAVLRLLLRLTSATSAEPVAG